jgi:hypothetical protein
MKIGVQVFFLVSNINLASRLWSCCSRGRQGPFPQCSTCCHSLLATEPGSPRPEAPNPWEADKFVANNNAFLIYRFLSRATVELTHQRQCPFVEQIVEAENQGNP